MKVIITGAKGQLGSQIINMIKNGKSEFGEINDKYKVGQVRGIDIEELDITDINAVRKYLSNYKPDIVINSAGYTNVDECEDNFELALKVNSLGVRNIAIVCEELKAKLVHISTDYVFAGDKQTPYKEYDIPSPLTVYGKTKLLGEKYVQQFCKKYFIVRTAWLYGYNGNNFVKTIIKLAKERGQLLVVNDQKGNPTNAEDLAFHILKLALSDEYGIYHCTNKGECTWYDFACKIVEYYGVNCIINSIKSDELDRAAKRPVYSSLDNMMLRCTVGDEMRQWQQALKTFIKNIKAS